MADYKCETCGKEFQRKANLTYHIKNVDCEELDRGFNCNYCEKQFTSNAILQRHIKHNCKTKKDIDNEKEDILNKLIQIQEETKKEIDNLKQENNKLKKQNTKEITKLKKQIDKLSKPTINNTLNKINNTNNGTVNNNVILVGYGKEDISKINRDDIIKALQGGFYSSLKLTEATHFNPKHPEYHNIYISNMKDKYAMKYDGDAWNLTVKDDLINSIYDDKKNYVEQNLDEFVESLTPFRINALKRWIQTDDDDPKILTIKNEIKLLLYNKRKFAENNIKKIKA
jgi:DNA-directed RNA polymerase subunit RPC12/RpoP